MSLVTHDTPITKKELHRRSQLEAHFSKGV